MSKLKEKLGTEKYKQLLEILKDTDIKENDIDILEGYIPRSRYNEKNEKLKAEEEKNKTLMQQQEETKKLLDQSEKFKLESEDFKNQYKQLETKHLEEIESKNKEITNIVKRSLVKEQLIQGGARYPDLLLKEIDFDKINVSENKLNNFDDTFKTLTENYKDLFTQQQNKQTTQTGGGAQGSGEDLFEGQDFGFLDDIKS